MVKNPGLIGQTTSASNPAPTPTQTPTLDVTVTTPAMSQALAPTYSIADGKCAGMGFDYCKNLVMPDNSLVPNPNFVPGQQQVKTQTVDRGDSDDDDDNNDNDNDRTYCDIPNPSNPCHDRKDISETTGLYMYRYDTCCRLEAVHRRWT